MSPIVDTRPAEARRVFSPRRRALAAVVLGVLAVHAWLLQPGAQDRPSPSATTAVADRAALTTVLRVTAAPAAPAAAVEATPSAASPTGLLSGSPSGSPSGSSRTLGAGSRPAPEVAGPALAPVPVTSPAPAPAAAAAAPTPAPPPASPPAASVAALAAAAPAGPNATGPSPAVASTAGAPNPSPSVPLYPTRLPPPTVRAYRLQQGLLSGEAEWRWQPAASAPGAAYEAQLLGRVAGLTLLDWRSSGTLDAAGVAPERFVVRRRGRGAQATNFQREALGPDGARGKVSFSAATAELPLVPGAQDRLSWMVQLPAVIAADPARWSVPGREIVLWVVGTRGDAEAWTFDVIGPEPVVLGDGRAVPALKLVREPRRAYDTQAEVWLDPAQHHLPLRARLRPTGNGEPLELLWVGDAGTAEGRGRALPTISP